MRQYLAMQALESGKPLTSDFLGRSQGLGPYGNGGMIMNAESNVTGKVGELESVLDVLGLQLTWIVIHNFTCKSLSIGTWRRVGQNAMDLLVFYVPDKA